MSEARSRLVAGFEVAVVGIALAVAVVGVALLPLLTPVAVRTLVTAVGAERNTGLSAESTLRVADSVRRFVLDPHASSLPGEVDGRPAFDDAAVQHLIDVRNVLVPAIRVTLVLAVALLAWTVIRARSAAGRRMLSAALRAAGWLLVGAGGAGMIAGLVDFDAFFSWFHSLFFAAGTWMFPDDALLIEVFPLSFWIAAAAAWGVLVLAVAVLLIVAGRRLRFTGIKYGV